MNMAMDDQLPRKYLDLVDELAQYRTLAKDVRILVRDLSEDELLWVTPQTSLEIYLHAQLRLALQALGEVSRITVTGAA